MPNYTLSHSEIDDKGYLFGIHCSLEPFNLAFKINSLLKIKLIRTNHDVTFKNKKERYMVYKNIVKKNETPLWLFSNSFLISKINKNPVVLFKEELLERSLLPEFPKTDYILKIIGESSYCIEFAKSLALLPEVLSCYLLPNNKIKSKHNLIFD
jgi:hypothetical protein|tara:strand:- start:2685 stop:3146 length:462 start_codon:yes stop_codon:yes gene_type:complete